MQNQGHEKISPERCVQWSGWFRRILGRILLCAQQVLDGNHVLPICLYNLSTGTGPKRKWNKYLLSVKIEVTREEFE